MGREVKRVALNFDWPMKKTWIGFVNPLYKARKCEACGASGSSPQARFLADQWYGNAPFEPRSTGSLPFTPSTPEIMRLAERNCTGGRSIARETIRLCDYFNACWSHHLSQADVQALIDVNRLYDFTSIFTAGEGWKLKDPPCVPTAAEVNLWSLCGMGHDSVNQWVCVSARCKALGYPERCDVCHGDGELWDSPEDKAAYEAWEKYEPPAGEGYQMWENTSEGSAISPVFDSAEKLAHWLADTGASAMGCDGATYEQWLRVCNGGYAPSMVGIQGVGLASGVAGIESLTE